VARSSGASALAHHTWATLRLIEFCRGLSAEQLDVRVPGTYGSILATLRHLVGDECFDLFVMSGESTPLRYAQAMELTELGSEVTEHGERWAEMVAGDPDPDADVLEVDPEDGFRRTAPLGIRLAQVLHHGAEHRTQVCVTIASLGLQPPDLSAFRFGVEIGKVTEVYPPE
jgi:uncharacterized damage-inducible protein DinB